jgi:hypothetical protein
MDPPIKSEDDEEEGRRMTEIKEGEGDNIFGDNIFKD